MPVLNRRSAALDTFIGNGITVAITVAQAFVLIPLCLRMLDSTVYSAWLAAFEVLIWVQLLDGGLPNLLTQRAGALAGREDWAGAARWSSTVLAGTAAIGLTLLVLAASLAPLLASVVGVPDGDHATFVACFRIGVLSSVILMLSNGAIGLSRGLQRTRLLIGTHATGAAAGLLVSVGLLLTGWGLWSLALGLLARAAIAGVGAVLFFRQLPAASVSWWASPSRAVAGEMRELVPSMSVASVTHILASNSEVLLVASVMGPAPALVYALTRRAFDGLRNLLDTIAWAVAGGFAHLVTAPDRHRSRGVLAEILWLRFAAASLLVAIVTSVNGPFVSLLFGGANYGGGLLTMAFAVQIMLGGQSFLANYLWRSTGAVRDGSLMLTGEALGRVVAVVIGLLVFGLPGAPLAAALVSGVALLLVHRRLHDRLPDGHATPAHAAGLWIPLGVLAAGAGIAWLPMPVSWGFVAATAGAVALAGGALLWFALPTHLTREILLRWRAR